MNKIILTRLIEAAKTLEEMQFVATFIADTYEIYHYIEFFEMKQLIDMLETKVRKFVAENFDFPAR